MTVRGPPEVIAGLRAELVVPRVDVNEATADKPHGSAVLPLKVDVADAEAAVQPPTVPVTW